MSADLKPRDTVQSGLVDPYRKDLALFRSVMAVVNSTPELHHGLALTLRTILESLGPDYAGIILLRERQHPGLRVAAQQGVWSKDVPLRIFVDNCPCELAIQARMPVYEPYCPSHTCRAELPADLQAGRLVTPLKTRQNTVVGALCLLCPADFQVDSTDLSLWEDVGAQIGRTIEDARINDQLQTVRELLQTLYAISDHLATSLDLDWVLSRVVELAVSATDARHGTIFMLPAPGAPTARILRDDLSPEQGDEVVTEVLEQGLAGWVVRHKEGTLITDTSRDPRWYTFPDEPDPPQSAIAVPLLSEGRVLGVLTLDHGDVNHFHLQHMGLLRAIAHQASVAIEKARLHKEVTHLAEDLAERVEERTRELKETQAQLVQAEKLAALGELAAGIAHEINNPLHILQLYVEHMSAQVTVDTPFVEFLEPMRNALDNIARLAGQLRDFSRPAAGEWKPVNVNKTLAGVLRLVNKEMMHCQIDVVQQLTDDLPMVSGDVRQLEQVFLNVILNARDAMPGGGRLTVETYTSNGNIHIRFTDTGVGIDEENRERIFEPYFTTKEDRGTGLGLAICQRIVAQHGGGISVSSRLGEGSIFILHLPVSRR